MHATRSVVKTKEFVKTSATNSDSFANVEMDIQEFSVKKVYHGHMVLCGSLNYVDCLLSICCHPGIHADGPQSHYQDQPIHYVPIPYLQENPIHSDISLSDCFMK